MRGNDSKCAVLILILLLHLASVKARVEGCLERNQWRCGEAECIDARKHCDGKVDCSNELDEDRADCSSYRCRDGEFRCGYGACIKSTYRCDGKRDCRDGSDESMELCQNVSLQQPDAGSCRIIQLLANGIITYPTDVDPLFPGKFVPNGGAVRYRCNANHLLVDSNGAMADENNLNYCFAGIWSIAVVPECKPFCSTKAIRGITIKATECSFNGHAVSCMEAPRPGTVATIKCADYYRSASIQTISSQSLTCGTDGRWSPEPAACKQKCGEEAPIGTPYIVGGVLTEVLRVPWHVGIYQQNEARTGFNIICGGSILNARMVISAMHCFWNRLWNEPNKPNFYRVAAGKTYSDLTYVEAASIFNVKEIIYDEIEYRDSYNNYFADIALLIVDPMIEFRAGISPVCIPYGLELEDKIVPTGWEGVVAGFGRTSTGGKVSEQLKQVQLPVIERNHCKEATGLPLTADKFCAGFLYQNVSVCQGDSGGGWVHAEVESMKKIYYLRGIVSTGVNKDSSCDSNKYTTFTNVLHYDKFIMKHEALQQPTI